MLKVSTFHGGLFIKIVLCTTHLQDLRAKMLRDVPSLFVMSFYENEKLLKQCVPVSSQSGLFSQCTEESSLYHIQQGWHAWNIMKHSQDITYTTNSNY